MPIRKLTPSTAGYKSYIDDKNRMETEGVKAIQGPSNNVVNQHSLIDHTAKNSVKNRNVQIERAIDKERKNAYNLLSKGSKNLEKRIKSVILSYNQIMYLIVQAEEEREEQVDQNIQRFLMMHKTQFEQIGISTRQSIYLEYNTIVLRNTIKYTDKKVLNTTLFKSNGLFTKLFQVVDDSIAKLDHITINPSSSGINFDFKA